MNCPNCQNQIPENAKACPFCATIFTPLESNKHIAQQNNFMQNPNNIQEATISSQYSSQYLNNPTHLYQQPISPLQDAGHGYALAIMILGLFSIFGGGIIAGIIALCLCNTYQKVGNGANADKVKIGKICSWISICICLAVILFYLVFMSALIIQGI